MIPVAKFSRLEITLATLRRIYVGTTKDHLKVLDVQHSGKIGRGHRRTFWLICQCTNCSDFRNVKVRDFKGVTACELCTVLLSLPT